MSDTDTIVLRKLKRLREGEAPRVLDLFSGCGGFSLGLRMAGCRIVGGVEYDGHAAASHARNFHGDLAGTPAYERFARPRDLTVQKPDELIRELTGEPVDAAIDFMIGGPPCPAFSRVGRAKLREIHAHPEAHLNDPRAKLYVPYLDYVKALRPVAVLMENVPDILNFGGHNLAEEICETLEEMGYRCSYTILNAAAWGVPSMRNRFFLMAFHEEAGVEPSFPTPTHRPPVRLGDVGMLHHVLRPLRANGLFRARNRYTDPPTSDTLDEAVTVREAIGDLPPIVSHHHGEMQIRARDLDAVTPRIGPASARLRHWLDADAPLTAHVIRSSTYRDLRIFSTMEYDEEYPRAWRRGWDALMSWMERFRDAGGILPEEQVQGRAVLDALGRFHAAGGVAERLPGMLVPVPALHEAMGRTFSAIQQKWEFGEDDIDQDLPDAMRFFCERIRSPDVDRPLVDAARDAMMRTERYVSLRETFRDTESSAGVASPIQPPLLPPAADAAVMAEHLEILRTPHIATGLDRVVLLRILAADLFCRVQAYPRIRADFVPPYNPMKFPNKWGKMHPDLPARTLLAHLSKDCYSHIHYDGAQARMLSVREAARLQSFPDSFHFCGAMNAAFRQIGNAVPPLMARALARQMRDLLKPTG